jgi:Na+:H+ antiporter, NhaA family
MITQAFLQFIRSERIGGVLLVVCTVLSLTLANSPWHPAYVSFWQTPLGGLTLQQWINDLLMALFFLLIGLKLEHELYRGELSRWRQAMLPLAAALGGMAVPALIHFTLNRDTPTQAGFGIPMATDIAFALAALSLLGSRIPAALKVFLVAFAVIDDLGAILLIATVYAGDLSLAWLGAAGAVLASLITMNRLHVMRLAPYVVGGLGLWFCVLKSGVHPTVAGVALAFAIPFSQRDSAREDEPSPSERLLHVLHKPAALIVLPLFALANTAIPIPAGGLEALQSTNGLGIVLGLALGKPIGILLCCALAVWLRVSTLPKGVRWSHVAGAGMLGGIGFTMSIFIANLAFASNPTFTDTSKLAVLAASLVSATLGMAWLFLTTRGADRARGGAE